MAMQAAPAGPIANITLPVALQGLGNWAAVIGAMCSASGADSAACRQYCFKFMSSMSNTLVSTLDPPTTLSFASSEA